MIVLLGLLRAGLPVLQDENNLAAFMQEVLERRAEDWKLRQNYMFAEKEDFEIELGASREPVFSLHREFNWYVRDGYLVRSPHRMEGVLVTSEEEKRGYEDRYIERLKERQREDEEGVNAKDFFGFEFDKGTFLLRGRGTWNGREVMLVDYFNDVEIDEALMQTEENKRIDKLVDNSMSATLFILPEEKRLVKMTVNNAGFDFLPGRWLVQVNTLTASMEMKELGKGVWVPYLIEASSDSMTAEGPLYISYRKEFTDFKKAQVSVEFYVEPESAFNRDEDEKNDE